MSKIAGPWGAKPGRGKRVPRIKLKTLTLRETLMAQVQAAVDISGQTPLEYMLDIVNDDSHPPEKGKPESVASAGY
jgi:hypothetical protein